MLLDRKLLSAAYAVVYIAQYGPRAPVRSREIAQHQGMPPRYLEQMLQRLVHAGILRGVRGPRGGYLLAREKRRITLRDIGRALYDEGEDGFPLPQNEWGAAMLEPIWKQVGARVEEELQQIHIAQLCDQVARLTPRKTGEERADFVI